MTIPIAFFKREFLGKTGFSEKFIFFWNQGNPDGWSKTRTTSGPFGYDQLFFKLIMEFGKIIPLLLQVIISVSQLRS